MKPQRKIEKFTEVNVIFGKVSLIVIAIIEGLMLFSSYLLPQKFGSNVNIYRIHYIVFLVFTLLVLFHYNLLKRHKEKDRRWYIVFFHLYSMVSLQWAIGITILDYMHYGVIDATVFITILFWVINLFNLSPKFTIVELSLAAFAYTFETEFFCRNYHATNIGKLLNVYILILLTGIVAIGRYHYLLKRYLAEEAVLSKNKELEEANQQTLKVKQELEQANQVKSQFLENMSHEIRTPISVILGMSELISEEIPPDPVAQYTTEIMHAGRNLLAVVNEILDFSDAEHNKGGLKEEKYSVQKLINQEMNEARDRAIGKRIQLKLEIIGNIPDTLVGDETRIRQVLRQLLQNAVKYTYEGSVCLKVSSSYVTDNRLILTFQVIDTGIGIKEEDMDRLFTPFERLDEKSNRGIEGTGLGLTMVRKNLELMGGTIKVQSTYQKGSCFIVSLDQKVAHEEEAGINSKISTAFLSGTAPEARILVVDDNEMNLAVVRGLLKKSMIQIDTALSGREALEKTVKTRYHVILLDHLMPEMDGVEVLHRLKIQEGGLNQTTPVIVVTANVAHGARKMYLDNGFDGYLAKPIIGKKLEEAVFSNLPDDLYQMTTDKGTDEESQITEMKKNIGQIFLKDVEIKLVHLKENSYQLPVKESLILFHTIKGNAATLELKELAESSARLEQEAKNVNVDVMTVPQEWVTQLKEGASEVSKLLETYNSEKNKSVYYSDSMGYLTFELIQNEWKEMLQCVSDYELEKAEDICQSLLGRQPESKLQKCLEEIKSNLDLFEYDAAIEILKKGPQ